MSNFDQIWNERQQESARAEGWELVVVVDSGKPINAAYLEIFDVGPAFPSRRHASQYVIGKAQQRSKLHIDALAACSTSRTTAATTAPRRKKTP